MKNIIKNFLKKTKFQDRIGNPPWDYYFLKNLDEREYPRYLAKLFYLNTGEKLPLKYDFKNRAWIIDKKRCKTFNQKIQWIKLYGITDLMRKCTDKVAVRDYVAEKIGSEYLKPVLQVIPSLNCDCHVIARNNSLECDEAIQGERSQLAMNKNAEDKQLKSRLDCHVAIAPRNDGQLNDVSTYFDKIDWENILNKKDTSASNSSRVDFSQPKQDVSTYFDQIDWENLPNAFVIKCNHGCKWHFIIKDKEAFLQNKRLFDIVKRNMTGWLEQDYSFFGGFEMQYATSRRVESPDSTLRVRTRLSEGIACGSDNEASDLPERKGCQDKNRGIEPKILIEPLMRDNIDKYVEEINIYCINTKPMFAVRQYINGENSVSYYDENCNSTDAIFKSDDKVVRINADENIKLAFKLSAELSRDFNFVRVDWMLYQNRIYFEELTFTPYSGFNNFKKNNNRRIDYLFERLK